MLTGDPIAVVTGASSGIGAAVARRLTSAGYHVVAAARRIDRLTDLASEIGSTALALDVTDADSVADLARQVDALPGALRVVVNNAGGALGLEGIEQADPAKWRTMFEVNTMGALAVTKALLPALRKAPSGCVVFVTSMAATVTYEGGAGYAAAKHAESVLARTLRLELAGEPIRVSEVAPGMVATQEFSLVRFGGDQDRADAVYAGVDRPLVADDVARCVEWVVTAPEHLNVDLLVVRPLAQAAQHKLHRGKLFR